MSVYYTKNINEGEAILGEEESRHCIRVLRLNAGDPVRLVDGNGNLYEAVIQAADPRSCRLTITGRTTDHLKRDYYLHLAIAPTKSSERFEWFLEKATEIGVDEITPLICEHSERWKIRMDRSEKILISAMKQSGRASLPSLNEAVDFDDFVSVVFKGNRLIAHCGEVPDAYAGKITAGTPDWLILIGPEGDFSPGEILRATGAGFIKISLGNAVFRTETAGIVACQIIADMYSRKG